MVHGYIIVVKRTGEDGSKYPLTEREVKIGTSAECSVRINTHGVASEQCALLVTDNGKVKVKNLCRPNPTIINNRPLIGEAVLKHQDILAIGERWLRFEYPNTVGRSSKKKTTATPKNKTPGGKIQKARRSLTSALNSTVHSSTKVQKVTATAKVQKTPTSAKSDGKTRIPKLGVVPGRRSLSATKALFSGTKRIPTEPSNDLVKSPKPAPGKSKSPVKRQATPLKRPGSTGTVKIPGLLTIAEGSPDKAASVRKTPAARKLLSPGFASAVKGAKKASPTARKSHKGSAAKKSTATDSGRKSVGGEGKTPKRLSISPKPGPSQTSLSARRKPVKRLSKGLSSPMLMDFSTPETARKSLAMKLLGKTPKNGKKKSVGTPSPWKYATPGNSLNDVPERGSSGKGRKRKSEAVTNERLAEPLVTITPDTGKKGGKSKVVGTPSKKSLTFSESDSSSFSSPYSPTQDISILSFASSTSAENGTFTTPKSVQKLVLGSPKITRSSSPKNPAPKSALKSPASTLVSPSSNRDWGISWATPATKTPPKSTKKSPIPKQSLAAANTTLTSGGKGRRSKSLSSVEKTPKSAPPKSTPAVGGKGRRSRSLLDLDKTPESVQITSKSTAKRGKQSQDFVSTGKTPNSAEKTPGSTSKRGRQSQDFVTPAKTAKSAKATPISSAKGSAGGKGRRSKSLSSLEKAPKSVKKTPVVGGKGRRSRSVSGLDKTPESVQTASKSAKISSAKGSATKTPKASPSSAAKRARKSHDFASPSEKNQQTKQESKSATKSPRISPRRSSTATESFAKVTPTSVGGGKQQGNLAPAISNRKPAASRKLNVKPDKNKKKALLILGKTAKRATSLSVKTKIVKTAIKVARQAKKRGASNNIDPESLPLATPSPAKREETPSSAQLRATQKRGSASTVTPGSGERGRVAKHEHSAAVEPQTVTVALGAAKRRRTSTPSSPAPGPAKRQRLYTPSTPLKVAASPSSPASGRQSLRNTPLSSAGAISQFSPKKQFNSPINSMPSIIFTPATSSSASSPGSAVREAARRVIDLSSIPPSAFGRRSSKRISSKNDVGKPDFTELSPTVLGLFPRNLQLPSAKKGRRSTSLATPKNRATSPGVMKAASTSKKMLRKNVFESFVQVSKNSTISDSINLTPDITQDIFVSTLVSNTSGSGDSTFNSTFGAQNWLHSIHTSPEHTDNESLNNTPNSLAFRNRIKQNLVSYLSPKKSTGPCEDPILFLNEAAVQGLMGTRYSARKLSPGSDEDSTSQNSVFRQPKTPTQKQSKIASRRRTPGSANDLTDVPVQLEPKIRSYKFTRCISNLQSSNPTDIEGVERLIGLEQDGWPEYSTDIDNDGTVKLKNAPQPLVKSPKNRLSDFRGVKKLLGTPRPKEKNPRNRLSDFKGVKQLVSTPKPKKSPRNELDDLQGVRQLLGSPIPTNSPKNRLSDLRGVKQLLGSPRPKQNSPKNRLSDLRGVKQLLGSPRPKQNNPKNRLSDLRGVKKLLGSPKPKQNTPKNRLSDLRGVKQLLGSPKPKQKSPKNSLEDVFGVKQLLGSPRIHEANPKNRLSDFRGVKQLMQTPKSPKNRLSDFRGVRRLLGPKQVSPKNDLRDVSGVSDLFASPKNKRSSQVKTKARVTKETAKKPIVESPTRKDSPLPSRSRGRAATVVAAVVSSSPPPPGRRKPVKAAASPSPPSATKKPAAKRVRKRAVESSPVKPVGLRGRAAVKLLTPEPLPTRQQSRRRGAKPASPPKSPVSPSKSNLRRVVVVVDSPVSSSKGRAKAPVKSKRKTAAAVEEATAPSKRGRRASPAAALAVPTTRGRRGRSRKSNESEGNVLSSTVSPVEPPAKGRGRSVRRKPGAAVEMSPVLLQKKPRARRIASTSTSSLSGREEPVKKSRGKAVKVTTPAAKKTPSPSPRKTRGRKVATPVAAAPSRAPRTQATTKRGRSQAERGVAKK